MSLLVVNADDFGLTTGVSRGILAGHREGIVTSTSALAVGPAFGATAAWLDDAPELGVGAHLALVGEDPPLLSAREIPTLVDRRGHLAPSWRALLPRIAAGRVDLADVERELRAQLDAVRAALRRPLTHVDTHQHLHLWPSIGRVVVALALEAGIAGVRTTRSLRRSPVATAVAGLARRFERTAQEAGLASTSAFAGFDEGGTLAVPVLLDTLRRLHETGAATAELGCHPGEREDPDLARYEWGYRWGDELDALRSPQVRRLVADLGYRLGTFADVAASAGP